MSLVNRPDRVLPRSGQVAFDRDGYRVGLVGDVWAERGTVSVLQAGFALGLLGRELIVSRGQIADCGPYGVTLTLSVDELPRNAAERAALRDAVLVG